MCLLSIACMVMILMTIIYISNLLPSLSPDSTLLCLFYMVHIYCVVCAPDALHICALRTSIDNSSIHCLKYTVSFGEKCTVIIESLHSSSTNPGAMTSQCLELLTSADLAALDSTDLSSASFLY